MSTTKTFNPPFKVGSASEYGAVLQKLYEQISAVKKNISYLDVYNITEVCENPDNFAAQVNALIPNSSLVINAPTFNKNDIQYETGDIILKMANDKIIHIKAQTGGVFKPDNLEPDGSGNYTLTYRFTKETPKDSDAKIFTNITPAQGEGVYASFISVDEVFDVIEGIKPYIKFYFTDNETPIEEVICDYELEEGSGSFNVTIKYREIKGSDTNTDGIYMLVK